MPFISHRTLVVLATLTSAALPGCGGVPDDGTGDPPAASSRQALAPFACSLVTASSTLPATLAPAENRWVTLVLQNTGTEAWPANRLRLVSKDVPVNLWGQTVSEFLPASIPAGTSTTLGLLLRAPGTPGDYSLSRSMKDYGMGGEFPCFAQTITVGGASPVDAAASNPGFPATMAPGETKTVSVTLTNTGTVTWTPGGAFTLYSKNTPVNLFGTTTRPVTESVPPGASTSLAFNVTAPQSPGSYRHVWQMREVTGINPGFFGTVIDLPVTVGATSTPAYGAQVAATSYPPTIKATQYQTFSITMKNTGSTAWASGEVILYSTSVPTNLWTTTQSSLSSGEVIGPGITKTFDVVVKAPFAGGSYPTSWRMRSSVVGLFGDGAAATLQVTACGNGALDPGEECDDGSPTGSSACSATCRLPCGNGAVDPGEECDDGNHVSGDGCTSTCRFEPGCGNGRLDPGEQCDDGNTTSGDRCSSSCMIENPDGSPQPCPGPILFPDPNLEQAVRGAIHKPQGDITPADVATVISLGTTNVQNLTGLECLTRLEDLSMNAGSLTELTPLTKLTQLRTLIIDGAGLVNATPLAALTRLESILLTNNQVADVSFLASMPRLSSLSLSGNRVTDLAPLASLTNLQDLILDDNRVTSLAPLSQLVRLRGILARNNLIASIDALAALPLLQGVDLEGNRVSDLAPLANHSALTNVSVRRNQVVDLGPLSTNGALAYIDASRNRISDLSPLAGMTWLISIDLTDNSILDLTPLSTATSLSTVRLGENHVTSLAPLVANAGLGSGDTVHVGPVDCDAEAANIQALTNRGVSLDRYCLFPLKAVSSGDLHTCALSQSGKVKCWGFDQSGEVGLPPSDMGYRTAPSLEVALGASATAVSVGSGLSCALLSSGQVRCWGQNEGGQLGVPPPPDFRVTPAAPVALPGPATAIGAGNALACALLQDGSVHCWGRNNEGNLGVGDTAPHAGPAGPVLLSGPATAIAVKALHACAVLQTGGLECWGFNGYGQLGNGNTIDQATPVAVNLGARATQASGNAYHSCALLEGGAVKCWGANYYGSLGIGSTQPQLVPGAAVNLTESATAVSAGQYFSCALLTSGKVECWGFNNDGELGMGDTTQREAPAGPIEMGRPVTQLASGSWHSCAVTDRGDLKCWGANFTGQLGLECWPECQDTTKVKPIDLETVHFR